MTAVVGLLVLLLAVELAVVTVGMSGGCVYLLGVGGKERQARRLRRAAKDQSGKERGW